MSSSRSAGPPPPTKTTAGPGAGRGAAGFDTVPESEKPLLGILTCSSLGREIGTRRDATDAMSSRTTSSDCSGTLKRNNRPFESPQTSASIAGASVGRSWMRVWRASIVCVAVWKRSGTDSPTRIENGICGVAWTRIVEPLGAVRSCAASASYGAAKKGWGRKICASAGAVAVVD